ncbi:unnamed protein product [Phytophthora lilii]|uniref:Unnamed protein product n=1 Tax=Phytophthora lilii TaxID=2077276 RepID=A0A9W7D7A4_9STRA|nr:unnamed protein product [Phytophthora lilii]
MEDVAADTMEESESMVEELSRRYKWHSFITRLQQDCGGTFEASLLIPTHARDRSSVGASTGKLSVKTILHKLLQEHGPALENGEMLQVRSVISLRNATTQPAPTKTSKTTPVFHFATTAAEVWTEVLGNLKGSLNATKPRRSASSSSTRRIRRLPPSRGSIVSTSEPVPALSTRSGERSAFRQLDAGVTSQFPGTACDVPLSSVFIYWMLLKQFDDLNTLPNEASGTSRRCWYSELADSNVYFDIAEYEHNFAAVMGNYATSAAINASSNPFRSDDAVLASARRTLRRVSAILERSREQKSSYSADTIFAPRQTKGNSCIIGDAVDLSASNQEADASGHSIYAQASILQLVQTVYYTKRFLEMLPPADAATLRKLEHDLQPEESTVATTSTSNVCMHALDDNAIHELLLIYVARGKCVPRQDENLRMDTAQRLTSLALSDAVNTLLPCPQLNSNQPVAAPFCIIKNPSGLWSEDKKTSEQDVALFSGELQRFRDADILFIEVQYTRMVFRWSLWPIDVH